MKKFLNKPITWGTILWSAVISIVLEAIVLIGIPLLKPTYIRLKNSLKSDEKIKQEEEEYYEKQNE